MDTPTAIVFPPFRPKRIDPAGEEFEIVGWTHKPFEIVDDAIKKLKEEVVIETRQECGRLVISHRFTACSWKEVCCTIQRLRDAMDRHLGLCCSLM